MGRPFRGKSTGIGLTQSRHFPARLNLCHSTIDSNPRLNSNEKSPILLNCSNYEMTAPLTPTISRLSSKTFERPISENEICVLNGDPRPPLKITNLKKCVTSIDYFLKPNNYANDLRRRTFSLGNASWFT